MIILFIPIAPESCEALAIALNTTEESIEYIYQAENRSIKMVVSAEKARQKAEARRQRILAKSAERMDVVSGLVPKGGSGNDDDDEEPATVRVNAVVEEVVDDPVESSAAAENDNNPSSSGGGSSKGARRMAAMRRRRYQNKKKESDETTTNNDDNEGKADDAAVVTKDAAEEEEEDKESSEPALQEEEPPAAESTEEESPSSLSSSEEPKKKYMGVARMRRKIIKEEKAKRIAELEAASDPIDAAAAMATLGMTASMIREGSGSVVGEVDLSEVAIKTLRGKKKWWKLMFPPMSLVPRLVTLMLLFMAGLDVGLEPHRARNATDTAGMNSGVGGDNLIYHVDTSFTKPWEYGMGGKARHMMGMKEAAPPTAMPTSFSREGFCVSGDIGDDGECVTLSTSNEKERSGKEKLMSKLTSKNNEEDEFADGSRPKGVSTSEFDDDEETYSPPVIDPIFQVDLDALLQNSQLPAPINFAAKFAIGFHRMWVRYLWTVPTSVLKSILYSPKTLVTSWMANPPVFLFISLLIRLLGKVLAGKTPSLSEEEDEKSQGKSDNMDILGKLKDTAMNYATSSFPKTILVLKTLKEVVTVDMYVILCGLLVGLVSPLAKQDLGFGSGKVLGDGEL